MEENRRGSNLWLWNGSETVQLTQEAGQDQSPSASGSLIVIQRSKPTISARSFDSDLYVAQLSKIQLSDLRQIVTDAGWPLLDRTGQRLAYVKQTQPTQQQLWVEDLESQHQWLVTDHLRPPERYAFPKQRAQSNSIWSAVGESIYFVEREANRQAIREFVFSSGTSKRIADAQPGVDLYDLRPSADGRRLAYIRRSAGPAFRSEVVVRDLFSGKETTVLLRAHDRGLRIFCPGWDADDALVILLGTVLADDSERLGAVRIDGSGKQSAASLAVRGFGGTARVDVSSESLILTSVDSQGFHNLTRVLLSDGRARQLTQNRLPGVSFAGIEVLDHQRVLFCRQESNLDLWLIDLSTNR